MPASTGPVKGALFAGDQAHLKEESGKKVKSLYARTGERFPHHGFMAVGRDPRVTELLANLASVRYGDDHEALLWVVCAGVWWLNRNQANEVADVLARVLAP